MTFKKSGLHQFSHAISSMSYANERARPADFLASTRPFSLKTGMSLSRAINVATVFKAQGKLTTAQIKSIDSALLIVEPICGAPVRPTSQPALDLVQSAIFTLAGVNAAAGSN